MAYSEESDLLTGSIPTPQYLSPVKFVSDAADEVDSKLGFLYKTPIVLTDTPENRPALLLLKRINNFIATGRLIMAVASPDEDSRVHAYASRLVNEAYKSLDMIANGSIELGDAEKLTQPAEPVVLPLVAYGDPESNVEAFYDRIANPEYTFLSPQSVPRGMIR